jgi:hypothetical protein
MQSTHCVSIDAEMAIDGTQRALDVACFSPCHINHSRNFNVARRTLRKDKRVELFATQDIRRGSCLICGLQHAMFRKVTQSQPSALSTQHRTVSQLPAQAASSIALTWSVLIAC